MGTKAPLREWLDACPAKLYVRDDDGSVITITIGVDAIEAAIAHVVAKARKGPPNHPYVMSSGWGKHGVVSAVRTAGTRDRKGPLSTEQRHARARIRLAYRTARDGDKAAILRGTDDRYLTLSQVFAPDTDLDYQIRLYDKDGFVGYRNGRTFATMYKQVREHLETDELTLSWEG